MHNGVCARIPKTYYIAPSEVQVNGSNWKIDFDVTVNGVYTNLPNGVSLPMYLDRGDGLSSYYSDAFNIPDATSLTSVGVYKGLNSYTVGNAGMFTLYDIGFDNGYTKEITKNGDTYIINRFASSKPKTMTVTINSSEVINDMYGNECGLGFSLVGSNCGSDQQVCTYDVDGSALYVDVCARGYGGGNAPSCTSDGFEYAGGRESAVEIQSVAGNYGSSVVGTTNKWNYDGDVVTAYIDTPQWCDDITPTNGKCGSGYGYPCEIGSPIEKHAYTGSYVWTWKCSGVNGGDASPQCIYQIKYDGQCNTHVAYACNGPMSATNTGYNESTHTFTWTCPGINGGSSTGCSLYDSSRTPIDGKCGTSNYTCLSGSLINRDNPGLRVSGQIWNGNYWECKGLNGGSTATCGTYWVCQGYCHTSLVGPACYLIYGTDNKNTSSWVNYSSSYGSSEAYEARISYCGAISDEATCVSQGIVEWNSNGTTLIKPVTLPYFIDPLRITSQSTKACCEYTSDAPSQPICYVNGISSATGCPSATKPNCQRCTAPSGYTEGTPPTDDCYNYTTTTSCLKNYYKRGSYQCASNETCNNGVCQGTCEQDEIEVSLAEVQHYQDDLGASCSCEGSSCCCALQINRAINVFFGTTPCDGAYIMDFLGSDGNTYSVRPDGCDDSIVETNCRFTINNLPLNMTSGNLRRKRMSNINGGWIECEDHGGTNLKYFDFNDYSYSEPDIDI